MKRHIVYRTSYALVFLLAILIVPYILIRIGMFADLSALLTPKSIPLLVLLLPLCSLLSVTLADLFLIIRGYTVCTVPLEATYMTALIITQEHPDEYHSRLFAPAWQYEYEGRPYSAENDFALTSLMLKDNETCTIYVNPQKPSEYRKSFVTYLPNMLKSVVGIVLIGFFFFVLSGTLYGM
ncbi:MAG: hypothetical protein IKK51_09415 [Oscillospiraceae bacterium]|nr:hypothetical protein [Oscillospiraceae bacterium]